jgi:hypothetical protein
MSKIGTRLITAARQARDIVRGEITEGFVAHVRVAADAKASTKKPDPRRVARLRAEREKT